MYVTGLRILLLVCGSCLLLDFEISCRYAEQEDHDEPHLTNGRAD
jgi:hypothetical protein